MNSKLYHFKRTAIHNLLVTSSNHLPEADVMEGLVLPRELMRLGDIAPYEKVLVTKHGGNNWENRMYTFAIPGSGEGIEVRGSLAFLLKRDEYCCVISKTYLYSHQYEMYRSGKLSIPMIDIRFRPKNEKSRNDTSTLSIVLEFADHEERIDNISEKIITERRNLSRIMLSNLVTGLIVNEVERHCVEMSAELPEEIMKKAGLLKNQTIFVYNASRGGMSAESYVIPNTRNNEVLISGALSKVASKGDIISEASFSITNDVREPKIFNAGSFNNDKTL